MPQTFEKARSAPNLFSVIDFGIEVFKEKLPDNGEDSFLYMFTPNSSIVGVFDGCGGSGAKKYDKYRGKTGAYMASRVVSGAMRDWFIDASGDNRKNGNDVASLKRRVQDYLKLCQEIGGTTTAFKGSLAKDFPTTAAVIRIDVGEEGVRSTCIWAGDSRCYLLGADGLKQLTEDDLGGLDAMENLSADGVLTNVITSSRDFSLHQKGIQITKPCLLFAATDGCFGYFSTPMEFEHLLLSTLYSSESVESWEASISGILQEVAGDDYSLSGVALGFGSFPNLKKTFENRYHFLVSDYIKDLNNKTVEDKMNLWRMYKPNYSEFL